MTSEDVKSRRKAIAAVEAHGWAIARITKKGYTVMRCSCGEHQQSFHKTPGNPKHFAERADHMTATCSTQVP